MKQTTKNSNKENNKDIKQETPETPDSTEDDLSQYDENVQNLYTIFRYDTKET